MTDTPQPRSDAMEDAERKEFEAHFGSSLKGSWTDPGDYDHDQDCYFSAVTQARWEFWLAARVGMVKGEVVEGLERMASSLIELICHAWVHSAYDDCGRRQMTTEQVDLYEAAVHVATDESLEDATNKQRCNSLAASLTPTAKPEVER